MSGKYLEIGTVGRAHGLKGEIGIDWHGDTPLDANAIIYLREKAADEYRPYKVRAARTHKGRLLIFLNGVDDRTAAERLNGQKVYLDRETLPPLEDDEAYLADIVGFTVKTINGTALGVLDHVEFPANQEIWVIKSEEGKEILFPAQECFIDSFAPDQKTVFINPPPGLVDIYNA